MATFEIKMPKLGESITEGTIISWSVKVGDTVEEDDVLFEVSRKPRRLLNRKKKSPLPPQRNYQRIPKRKIVGILPSYCN